MLTKSIKQIAKKLGYDIRKRSSIESGTGFQKFIYRKPDGTFDYERYRRVQIAGNARKIEQVFVIEENVAFLADYLKSKIGDVQFGICHGTRRGKEQEWFRKYLGCDVVGTEISETAAQFPNTIQWDFHEVNPEWVGAVDFIYSNSFDHSYDPDKCLNAWMSCLKKDGICIIEHTAMDEEATELDPFGASILHMPYLILKWGRGKFHVVEILDAPTSPESYGYIQFLVIKKP